MILNTKTYSFTGVTNGISAYANRDGGMATGFSNVTTSLRFDSKVRGQVKLDLPIVASEASACACPGTVTASSDANISFRMDKTLTLAERTDFALRLKDLVASAEFQGMIINFQLPVA